MKTKIDRKRESKELVDSLKSFEGHKATERARRGKVANYIKVLLERIEQLENEVERKPRGRPRKKKNGE